MAKLDDAAVLQTTLNPLCTNCDLNVRAKISWRVPLVLPEQLHVVHCCIPLSLLPRCILWGAVGASTGQRRQHKVELERKGGRHGCWVLQQQADGGCRVAPLAIAVKVWRRAVAAHLFGGGVKDAP